MKNALYIDFANDKIVMTTTFAKKCQNTASAEYAQLQSVRRDYPTFAVTTRKIKSNPNKETYKGLTYSYMESYIKAHDDENKSIMAEYEMLRGRSQEAQEALAEGCSYIEIKAWFLNKFPAIAEFHKKREALLAA